MSTELLDEPELETESQAGHLDPEFRPAASRDAHDAAADPRAGRRTDHQGHARYRLSAFGLRETGRAPQLQPVRHGRRPQELHQPADERGGLAPRRREAAGYRADPALPVHPCDHLRAGADQRSLALHRRGRARPGGVHGVLVRLQPREQIYDVYEEMSGYRFHPGYTRVGGVLYDFNDRVLDKVRAVLDSFPKVYSDMEKLLVPQPDLSRPACAASGCCPRPTPSPIRAPARSRGPAASPTTCARTSLTSSIPSSISRSPIPTEGDCWARFIVRMEEMRQSHRILEQALKKLPAGPVNVPIAEKFPLPDKLTTYNSMEGLIQHFELIMPNRGVETPHDEVYAAVESPNGELGYYLVADGSQTAWRVRTRPPSFIHFAVFPHMIKDYLLADVVAVLGSLNIIAAELDR